MKKPRFSIGNAVAAINPSLTFVVPIAHITRRKWREAGELRVEIDKVIETPAGWFYTLDTHSRSPLDGRKLYWIGERLLRPIDDDEYKDTLQDEQPINTWRGGQHKSPEEIQRMMDNAN